MVILGPIEIQARETWQMDDAATNIVFSIITTLLYFSLASEFTVINLFLVFSISYATIALIPLVPSGSKENKSK